MRRRRSALDASTLATCPVACTPVSVRPATARSSQLGKTASRASRTTPSTVRRPGCRAQPRNPVPSYSSVSFSRTARPRAEFRRSGADRPGVGARGPDRLAVPELGGQHCGDREAHAVPGRTSHRCNRGERDRRNYRDRGRHAARDLERESVDGAHDVGAPASHPRSQRARQISPLILTCPSGPRESIGDAGQAHERRRSDLRLPPSSTRRRRRPRRGRPRWPRPPRSRPARGARTARAGARSGRAPAGVPADERRSIPRLRLFRRARRDEPRTATQPARSRRARGTPSRPRRPGAGPAGRCACIRPGGP